MKRPIFLLALTALLSSCGSHGHIDVMVSPASANVQVGTDEQFTATVTGTSNAAVTWQVNGTQGGNSTVGTITAGGLYAAPQQAPDPDTVTITAVSQANTVANGQAVVTVTTTPELNVNPNSVTVPAGGTQQFTANGGATMVTWQVNGIDGGSAAAGTITTGGLYTAPATPPPGQAVTLTAISQSDSSLSATATITVAPGLSTLNGAYTFQIRGQSSSGTMLQTGSFQADGKGTVTNGLEDVNGPNGVSLSVTFTGTYTMSTNGTGSLTITPASSSGLDVETLEMVLTSNISAQLIRYDNAGTGIGTLDLNDTSAFTASALKGNYVLSLSNGTDAGVQLNSIALLTLNGSNSVTSGLMDENDNGSVNENVSVSGPYLVDSNGRGTMTISGSLGKFDFAFYIISATEFRLISVDSGNPWAGTANAQQGTGFTNANLDGGIVYLASGQILGVPAVDAGQFTSNGSGTISSGIGDENNNGSITNGYSFTGVYGVASNGHGSLTISSTARGSYDYSLYVISTGQAVLLRTDTSGDSIGMLKTQDQSQFSASNFTGPFGLSASGTASGEAVDKVIAFTVGSSGNITGSENDNNGESISGNLSLTATSTVQTNGRGSMTVTAGGVARTLNFYMITPTEMYVIGLDSDQVLGGGADQQFPLTTGSE
jgi:hypothetical protein